MPEELIYYDMRKLVLRFSSNELRNMAYVKKVGEKYYAFFIDSVVDFVPDNQRAIKDASDNGVLFAYVNPESLELLDMLASELNQNPPKYLTISDLLYRILEAQ